MINNNAQGVSLFARVTSEKYHKKRLVRLLVRLDETLWCEYGETLWCETGETGGGGENM